MKVYLAALIFLCSFSITHTMDKPHKKVSPQTTTSEEACKIASQAAVILLGKDNDPAHHYLKSLFIDAFKKNREPRVFETLNNDRDAIQALLK